MMIDPFCFKLSKSLLTLSFFVVSNNLFAEVPAITSFFPASVQRGATVEIKLNGKPGTQPVKVWSETDQLNQFQFNEKGDSLTLTAQPDARLGIHWIRYYNSEGASSQLPFYVGALNEITEKEPNNSTHEAESIESLPVTINGVLHKSGEVDTFAVVLKKGELFTASVDAHEAFGSPMDSVLQILDEQGFVILQNDDDHGIDPLLEFEVPHDGKFLVRVFCFPAAPNSTINFAGGSEYIYRLTLTTDEFNTAPELKEVEYKPDVPGLHHFFDVLSEHNFDLTNDNKSSTLPFTSIDVLEKRDQVQSVGLDVKKGESLRVQVFARKIASHLDPVLTVRNPDGSVHKEIDDPDRLKRDIDDVWTAPSDGKFTFEVSDRYQHAGNKYFSILAISENRPGLELTVANDHFEAKRDESLEIEVTVGRASGFKDQIKVQLKNPPPGVSFEEATSEEKSDSAKKVALKIDVKDAEAFQGPIQIVGVHGEENIETVVTTKRKIREIKTTSIWLTIPEKPVAEEDKAVD